MTHARVGPVKSTRSVTGETDEKETLIEQRERESVPKPPPWSKGYIELEGIGIFRDGEEPVGFWQCLIKTLEFWKWDYR